MKDIKGYGGTYAITEDGRIWSHERKTIGKDGKVYKMAGKWLSPIDSHRGYLKIGLYIKGHGVQMYIHRLVISTFLREPEEGEEVNHKNGIKTDNRLENLEWVSAKQNTHHAFANGLMKSRKMLTEKQKNIACILRANGVDIKDIAKMFKVSYSNISHATRTENRPRLTQEQRSETIKLYSQGESTETIANKVGINRRTVYRIVNKND